jgi:hypothetical protein
MLAPLAATDALFHTPAGIAFADLMVDGHRETWPIRSTFSDLVETSLLSRDRERFERANDQFDTRYARGAGSI